MNNTLEQTSPNNWAIEETNVTTDKGHIWVYKFYFKMSDGSDGSYLTTTINTPERIQFQTLTVKGNDSPA